MVTLEQNIVKQPMKVHYVKVNCTLWISIVSVTIG